MTDQSVAVAAGKAVSLTYSIHEVGGGLLEQVDTPVTYLHGSGRLLPKVEAALEGRTAGDNVTVEVSSDQAFGAHDHQLTFVDDLDNVPDQFRRLGAEVEMTNDKGEKRTFVVSAIENGKLTLDGNHPYAGKALQFHVIILEVRDPTMQELESLGGITRH